MTSQPSLTAAVAGGVALGVAYAWRWHQRRHASLVKSQFELSRIVRPNILRMNQYAFPPRYEFSDPVLLDANENPHGSPIKDASDGKSLGLERYPDPRQLQLKEAFAKLRGIPADQVLIGVGSDEIIDMLIRIFCRPSMDSIVICSPTYAMYSVFAEINDVGIVDVPQTASFRLQLDLILASLAPTTKLIFLCSPGNPTGNLIPLSEIESVLAAASNSIVVVDEAYIDFAQAAGESEVSAISLLAAGHPNLIVSQTLSKAWGLAGARLGVAFAPKPIVDIANKMKAPFNISMLSEDVALRALSQPDIVVQHVLEILSERTRVASALRAMAPDVSAVYHSDANFILFKVQNARVVCDAIAKESNVVVRYRGSMLHCRDCIRVTIGTSSENDQFLAALQSAMS